MNESLHKIEFKKDNKKVLKPKHTLKFKDNFFLAGVEGLEPSRTVLETGMLPLHHTPMTPRYSNTKKIKSQ